MNPAKPAEADRAPDPMGLRMPVKSIHFFSMDHRCKGAYDTHTIDCTKGEGQAHHRADYLPSKHLLEVRFYPPGSAQAEEVRYVAAAQASFVLCSG